jgi:hypothetical protein
LTKKVLKTNLTIFSVKSILSKSYLSDRITVVTSKVNS